MRAIVLDKFPEGPVYEHTALSSCLICHSDVDDEPQTEQKKFVIQGNEALQTRGKMRILHFVYHPCNHENPKGGARRLERSSKCGYFYWGEVPLD